MHIEQHNIAFAEYFHDQINWVPHAATSQPCSTGGQKSTKSTKRKDHIILFLFFLYFDDRLRKVVPGVILRSAPRPGQDPRAQQTVHGAIHDGQSQRLTYL